MILWYSSMLCSKRSCQFHVGNIQFYFFRYKVLQNKHSTSFFLSKGVIHFWWDDTRFHCMPLKITKIQWSICMLNNKRSIYVKWWSKLLKEKRSPSKIGPLNFVLLSDFLKYWKKLCECLFQTKSYLGKCSDILGLHKNKNCPLRLKLKQFDKVMFECVHLSFNAPRNTVR